MLNAIHLDEDFVQVPLGSVALGNPIGFYLTEGHACELDEADVLLPQLEARTVIADNGFGADKRILEPLQQAGKRPSFRPRQIEKCSVSTIRNSKARHLIENFFATLMLRNLADTLK